MQNISPDRVIRQIINWRNSRTPAALIRYGEGEAKVLLAQKDDRGSIKVATKKLRRQLGALLPLNDVFKIKDFLNKSMTSADIIGLKPSSGFSVEHEDAQNYLIDLHKQSRVSSLITDCLINNRIYESLSTIIGDESCVGVIGCRDIATILKARYNVGEVRIYQTPSQFVMRTLDDEYEKKLHEIPFWPNYYEDLYNKIAVNKPGTIFLVGAGILGKALCARIKSLGGIALDLGSKMDALVDKTTRGPNRPVFYEPWQ